MKTEAKVGAFTLAGLLLLAALVIGLSGFSLRSGKGYTSMPASIRSSVSRSRRRSVSPACPSAR